MKLLYTLLLISNISLAQDWESSPYNWDNSRHNLDNSSLNWNNSPYNLDNSPNLWGNERIIRDENGKAQGYAVPKADGGVNFYDRNGNRNGYLPKR
jgi:hypothetical protein